MSLAVGPRTSSVAPLVSVLDYAQPRLHLAVVWTVRIRAPLIFVAKRASPCEQQCVRLTALLRVALRLDQQLPDEVGRGEREEEEEEQT